MTFSVFVLGSASVLTEGFLGGDGQAQSVSVSDVGYGVAGLHWLSVLVPSHFRSGRRVHDANHFGLVSFSRVHKSLLLVNLGPIYEIKQYFFLFFAVPSLQLLKDLG